MIRFDSPLKQQHEQFAQRLMDRPDLAAAEISRPGAATGERPASPEVEYLPYGPRDEHGRLECAVIGTFGEVQAEYAAIRNGAGLLDSPHRATIRVAGADRVSFLNSMLTAELNSLSTGDVRESFWLNRKGRIEADLMLAELGEQMLIDVDVHALDRVVSTLESFLFAENVVITSAHDKYHRVTIHGSRAIDVIAAASADESFALDAHCCATVSIAGIEMAVARCDQTGEVGLHLFLPRDGAEAVWRALLATDESTVGKRRVRPIGWHAFNVARIEAGTPLFNIDFGTDHLPHETGILDRRVSFTKGCFLGQEVVARMQHLGKPKRVLVGLRMQEDLLPVEGTAIFSTSGDAADGDQQSDEQIGIVTSSTLSPLLGAQPIAFGMLKSKFAEKNATVFVQAEQRRGKAVVGGLNALVRPGE